MNFHQVVFVQLNLDHFKIITTSLYIHNLCFTLPLGKGNLLSGSVNNKWLHVSFSHSNGKPIKMYPPFAQNEMLVFLKDFFMRK